MDYLIKQIAFLSEAFKIFFDKFVLAHENPSPDALQAWNLFKAMLDNSVYNASHLLNFANQLTLKKPSVRVCGRTQQLNLNNQQKQDKNNLSIQESKEIVKQALSKSTKNQNCSPESKHPSPPELRSQLKDPDPKRLSAKDVLKAANLVGTISGLPEPKRIKPQEMLVSIRGAIREFQYETLSIFGPSSSNQGWRSRPATRQTSKERPRDNPSRYDRMNIYYNKSPAYFFNS